MIRFWFNYSDNQNFNHLIILSNHRGASLSFFFSWLHFLLSRIGFDSFLIRDFSCRKRDWFFPYWWLFNEGLSSFQIFIIFYSFFENRERRVLDYFNEGDEYGFSFFLLISSLSSSYPEICLESLTGLKEIKKIKEKNEIYENCFLKYIFRIKLL